VLAGDVRPEWLSDPIVVTHEPVEQSTNEAEEDLGPTTALFAVCLSPDDSRCQA
jgi:hypothetical protein